MSDADSGCSTARTRYCAVYGHPILHSASPAMQNAALTALALPWRYLAFDVHPSSLSDAIQGAKAMKFIGLNLTVPHKLLALPMADLLDDSGKRYGAINTIRFEARTRNHDWMPIGQADPAQIEGTRAVGFNTDAEAIIRSLTEDLGFEPRGASVLLLGAGGAGRVAALRLAEEGVRQLFLVNRTESKAAQVASDLRARSPATHVTVGYPDQPVDLALNATSLGLSPGDSLPFDPQLFSLNQARAVYDMVYRPARTQLLQAAEAAGCRTANGLGMLLHQGARALEIWSGLTAPVQVMKSALERNVYGPRE